MKHRPYSLYKKQTKKGKIWYVRYWNAGEQQYSKVRSTGIFVTGKRGRYYEADKTARTILKTISFGVADKTVVEYLKDFWQPDGAYALECKLIKKKPLSFGYIRGRISTIKHHMEVYPEFSQRPISELTAGSIRDWMIWLAQNGRSSQIIDKSLSAMRKAIVEGVKREELRYNPTKNVESPLVTHQEKGILNPDEVKLMVETITDRKMRIAILLGALCGMRAGEVRGLRYEDIRENNVNIQNNYQDHEGDKNPKFESFGTVPLPQFLIDEIGYGTGYIFPNRNKKARGKPACARYFWAMFRRAACLIGITGDECVARNLSFHSLRHTFITNGQLGGVEPIMMSALARHKSLMMTGWYTHPRQVLNLDEARGKLKIAYGFEAQPRNSYSLSIAGGEKKIKKS